MEEEYDGWFNHRTKLEVSLWSVNFATAIVIWKP
eukprot:UN20727